MRRTSSLLIARPKDAALNPKWHKWRLESEPWPLLRNMGQMAGTGFYIPPEWYNHFRMFPPVQSSFLEEQTLNPHNASEQTEFGAQDRDTAREDLRKELSAMSKSAATEGHRYYNMFWVEKAMDKMERSYYHHKSRGVTHQAALGLVLEEYYQEQSIKKRAHIIQSEEARLSGKFISMREASTLLTALSQFPTMNLSPQQYVELADRNRDVSESTPVKRGRTRRVMRQRGVETRTAPIGSAETTEGKSEGDSKPAPVSEPSADDLASMMEEEEIVVADTLDDSNVKLQETAEGGVGKAGWYTGGSPTYEK